MESFSLLKYWRGGGGGASSSSSTTTSSSATKVRTTTIAASVLHHSDTDDDNDDDDDFFDLEFDVREDDDEDTESGDNDATSEDEVEMDKEFKFSVDGNHRSDPALSLSPSNDLFFKGRLVSVIPTADVVAEPDSKLPQFPVSLRRSATKLRVLMLGLRRPKLEVAAGAAAAPPKQQQQQLSRLFIKFKIEEVPIMSLFTRDNSSRSRAQATTSSSAEEAEEKRFAKEVVQKYINKIKPLYVRVSKRHGSGGLSSEVTVEKADGVATTTEAKRIAPPVPSVVKKRLGKSRSAPSAAPASSTAGAQRRDDSLLQQQDGIQSAIAHCKRSFNGTRGSREPVLVRSKSDPGGDGMQEEVEEEEEALLV